MEEVEIKLMMTMMERIVTGGAVGRRTEVVVIFFVCLGLE